MENIYRNSGIQGGDYNMVENFLNLHYKTNKVRHIEPFLLNKFSNFPLSGNQIVFLFDLNLLNFTNKESEIILTGLDNISYTVGNDFITKSGGSDYWQKEMFAFDIFIQQFTSSTFDIETGRGLLITFKNDL